MPSAIAFNPSKLLRATTASAMVAMAVVSSLRADKGPVNFEGIYRQLMQITEGRIASAKVVDTTDVYTSISYLLE